MTWDDYLEDVTGTVHTSEEGEDKLDNYLRPFNRCKKIGFHQVLRKPIFIDVSLSGNEVRLSKDEIYRFV